MIQWYTESFQKMKLEKRQTRLKRRGNKIKNRNLSLPGREIKAQGNFRWRWMAVSVILILVTIGTYVKTKEDGTPPSYKTLASKSPLHKASAQVTLLDP